MRSVNLGRWSRRVERYFNMKGGGGLMDVEQSLRMVLSFASGVEERYLEGWNRFAVVANQAAVAAQNSRCRIRNPVGSNMIAVIEQLSLFTSGPDNPLVTWGPTTTDLTTLVTLSSTRMDPRGSPQPTSIVSINAQAAGGQAFMQQVSNSTFSSNYIQTVSQEIPVLPGQVVDVQATNVNVGLDVTFMWRERALEQSELT